MQLLILVKYGVGAHSVHAYTVTHILTDQKKKKKHNKNKRKNVHVHSNVFLIKRDHVRTHQSQPKKKKKKFEMSSGQHHVFNKQAMITFLSDTNVQEKKKIHFKAETSAATYTKEAETNTMSHENCSCYIVMTAIYLNTQ